jgi:hypothetical protein
MSASHVLLAARGQDDRWLSMTPDRTYFETISKPRVNRSRESFEIPFDNQPVYGTTGRCTVPPKGDFLNGLTLRTILPAIYPTQSGEYVFPTPSSQVGANVYVNINLSKVVTTGTALTANTVGNHYFSIGAAVTLAGTVYLDGTYTISSIPTSNSFTCSTTLSGTSYTGTASVVGIVPSDVVSYFSTQNSQLWVNNLTNKTWQIAYALHPGGNIWTFATSAPSNFPVGNQVIINLPKSGIINKIVTVLASTDTTFNCALDGVFSMLGGTQQARSSDYGVSWSLIDNPISGVVTWNSIAFGSGVFVAVARDKQAFSTDNGLTWTFVSNPLSGNWTCVAFGDATNVFVMGDDYSYGQAISTDYGLTWTYVYNPGGFVGLWQSTAYGNDVFVMAGNSIQARSINYGVSWTPATVSLPGVWYGVSFGHNVFVMLGQGGQQARSIDYGDTWTLVNSPLPGAWQSTAYGNDVFVMVGDGIQARSINYGYSWTAIANPLPGTWRGVAFGHGVFVMVGADHQAISTDNGLSWTLVDKTLNGFWTVVAYGDFAFNGSIQSNSVSFVVPPVQVLDRVFSSSVYSSISFTNADDAAFWGFDSLQGLSYSLPATPQWTLVQSGWIAGFLPPSLSTYVDSVTHKLCKAVRIKIGKQTIKEFTGEYIELQNDLWVPYENKAILKLLNGTLDQTQSVAAREYYVRIPLGTHEYPLCALTQQHLSIEIDFENYSALSDNLNQGTGQFTDFKSFTSFNDLSIRARKTFSYQQYIFILTWEGEFVVYDTTKSFTDPTSYQIVIFFSPYFPLLFSQFCVLSGNLYILCIDGQLVQGILDELVQGVTTSFILNSYTPTIGCQTTGTIVSDFRYVYYTVRNIANSNVFVSQYDTTLPFTSSTSYKIIDFTRNFNSNVNGVYQFISTGQELIMIPKGVPGKLYTFQFNANVQSQWYTLNYFNYGYQITEGVVIGNSVYFVCDNFNIIKYSDSLLQTFTFSSIFVTTGQIYSYNNGLTWALTENTITQPVLGFWNSIAFGNGVFVMVGPDNQAFSTDNGLTWTSVSNPLSGSWTSVTFGNGAFVAVGQNNQAFSTDNGLTWKSVSNPLLGVWTSVAFGHDVFVAVAQSKQAISSDNGLTWTSVSNPLSGIWVGVAFGHDVFVMTDDYYQQARSTTYGNSWTLASQSAPVSGPWSSAAYANDVFVLVGNGIQARSIDYGDTWTSVSNPLPGAWRSVTSGSNVFVMVATNPNKQAFSTDKGVSWTLSSKTQAIYSLGIAASSQQLAVPGDGLRNMIAVGNSIYCSTNNVAVQIDTTQDLSTQSAYQIAPAPLATHQYIFANGPRYVYLFTQETSSPIQRFDPYAPNTAFKSSIIADYESLPSGTPKPVKAFVPIVQTQKVTDMTNMDIYGPVKELWVTGAHATTNVFQYSNLATRSTLELAGEKIVTDDDGTHTFLNIIEPFETHTSMPIRNVSVISFEFDPESETPNGTINFSRIRDQVFSGNAESVWARTYNILAVQGGIGGLIFNS